MSEPRTDLRPLKASDNRHPINNDKSQPQTLIGVCPMVWWIRVRRTAVINDLHTQHAARGTEHFVLSTVLSTKFIKLAYPFRAVDPEY